MMSTYKIKDKLDCHAALDFLEAAKESFSALESDLEKTRRKILANNPNDSRVEVLLLLSAKMKRFADEAKEAYDFINRINRF